MHAGTRWCPPDPVRAVTVTNGQCQARALRPPALPQRDPCAGLVDAPHDDVSPRGVDDVLRPVHLRRRTVVGGCHRRPSRPGRRRGRGRSAAACAPGGQDDRCHGCDDDPPQLLHDLWDARPRGLVAPRGVGNRHQGPRGAAARSPGTCWSGLVHARRVDVERIRARVQDRPVYVPIDIDVLDPAFAPGTGTPEAGGLQSRELLAILRGLAGTDIVGADIVEVSPPYDHAEITGIAASHATYELISVMATSSRT
ncbi:arginase family protein [Nocardioides sp.]|uniref:arginase family protein n=1 Tax=Nocardioides sp. TaxID=35761 RepID=UPI00378320C6